MWDRSLPDGWRESALRDVAEVTMGQAPAGATVSDWDGQEDPGREGLPFIQGNAEFSSKFPVARRWCSSPSKIAEAGDILVSVRAPVGAVNIAPRRLAIGRGLASVRLTGMYGQYAWHALPGVIIDLHRVAQGTTFDAVSSADLGCLKVRVPPSREQVLIAGVLDAIERVVEGTEDVVRATERVRETMVGELLTRGMPGWHSRWKRVDGVGVVPACWEVLRLGALLSRVQYGTNAVLSETANGVAVLRMGNLDGGEVNFEGLKWAQLSSVEHDELLLRPGDILFNRTNSIDLVGKVGIVRELPFEMSFASYLVRLRTNPAKADAYWLNAFLNWRPTQGRIRRMATKGASQANVNPTNLQSLAVPCPSLAEQGAIGAVLGGIRARLRSEEASLVQLHTVKATVADALLSGRVRVKERDEE